MNDFPHVAFIDNEPFGMPWFATSNHEMSAKSVVSPNLSHTPRDSKKGDGIG